MPTVKKLIKDELRLDLMGASTHKNSTRQNPWTKKDEDGFMADFMKVAYQIVDQSQYAWVGRGNPRSEEYKKVTAKMENAKTKYEKIMDNEYSDIDTLKSDLAALTDILKAEDTKPVVIFTEEELEAIKENKEAQTKYNEIMGNEYSDKDTLKTHLGEITNILKKTHLGKIIGGPRPHPLRTNEICQGLEVYIANQKGYYKEGGEYKKNPDDIQKVWNVVTEYLKGLEKREGVTDTKRNKVQDALLEFMVEPTEKNKTEIINQLNSKKKMYRGPVIRAIKSKAGFGGNHQAVVEKLQKIQLSDQPSQEPDQLHRRSFADALELNKKDEGGPRIDPTAHEHEGPKNAR